MSIYQVGEIIITKKPHACGCNEWQVTRVGADVKLTCSKCKRSIFFSPSEVEKMTKERRGIDAK